MADHFVGIDIGSTMTKVGYHRDVLELPDRSHRPRTRRLANKVMEEALLRAHLQFESVIYSSYGYGRINGLLRTGR